MYIITSVPIPGCAPLNMSSGGGPPYFLCPVVTSRVYPVRSNRAWKDSQLSLSVWLQICNDNPNDLSYNRTQRHSKLPLFSPRLVPWWTLVLYFLAFLSAYKSSWLHKGKHSCSRRIKKRLSLRRNDLDIKLLRNTKVIASTCTWDRSLSLNCCRTVSAPSSLNSRRASMALSSRST